MKSAFGSEVPNPATSCRTRVKRREFLTREESLGIRQPYSAHEVSLASIGAHAVPEDVHTQIQDASRVLFVTFLK
jgi:hypothetical protein